MKYTVSYSSGATGYGWEREYERLDEFEDFINECRNSYTAQVRVWDSALQKCIFWKRLSWKPEIDMLHDILRDMRTTDRKTKRKISNGN